MKPDYSPEVWHCTAEAVSEVLSCSAHALAPHADLSAGMNEDDRQELGNALVDCFDIPYCESAFEEFALKAQTPMELAGCIETYLLHTDRPHYYWQRKLQAQAQEGEL